MLENNYIILSGISELLISIIFGTVMITVAINFIKKL